MQKDVLISPGTLIIVDLDGISNVPASYIKRRGPNTHMVCIGNDKLVAVSNDQIILRGSIEADDQVRLSAAAKPFLKERFRFVGYH